MNYLIEETTTEERKKIVEKAFAISLSGADKPSDAVIQLANDYIEGKRELEEIQKLVVEAYKNKEISENE